MPYQLFQYPIPGPGDLRELNACLASQRVLNVQQHLVTTPGGATLVFVVQTVEATAQPAAGKSARKTDYKTVLSPGQFSRFSHLRELRKQWAEKEGVPVYTLFSNEQLAEMVRQPVHERADLARIPGVGQARLDKYGELLLDFLRAPEQSPEGSGST